MIIRLTFGRLRRMLAEAMTDDQARRRELRKNPQQMDVEDALDEFVSMLGPYVVVKQQDDITINLSMPGESASRGARDLLADEVSYTLVDELGYNYEDGLYRRGNTTVTIAGGITDANADTYEMNIEFMDDSPGSAPVEIDAAEAKAISPVAVQILRDVDEDEFADRVFWTLSSPNDTNEVELRSWLKKDWEKMAIEHDGQSVVMFSGLAVDDESGDMWDESLGEWHNYMF